jgi:hypothetical protein
MVNVLGSAKNRDVIKLEDFLDVLIPHPKTLKKHKNAEPFHDLVSGGFIWSDERLYGLSVYSMGCLRAVFRYRTSLIVQEPDERFASLWNALREKCPEWIGFHSERCSPNQTLAERYREESRIAYGELET